MTYYMAKSLFKLREQINARFPARSKVSDGWIGNQAHAARHSDHNPDASGCVCAMDLTHDPASGMDSYALAEALREAADHRIAYIISNGRIANPKIEHFGWRPYHGANKHDHHVHISVIRQYADETQDWDLSGFEGKKVSSAPRPARILRQGDHGPEVTSLQERLGLKADGIFGQKTKKAIQSFQKEHGLLDDGIVGPATAAAMKEKAK